MGDPIFCSYYTNDKYKAHANDKLAPSLRRYGLDYEIDYVPTLGDWLRETHYKPSFVLQKLEKHKDRDVIWVDADCEVVAFPELLFDLPHNALVAAHYSTLNPEERRMLYNTVVYFRNRPYTRHLVISWLTENAIHPEDRTDQVNLENVLEAESRRQHPPSWDWLFELPPTYCWLEYAMRGPLGASMKPVINHAHEARARWARK